METAAAAFTAARGIGLTPPAQEPLWIWCERHIVVDKTSPMPGRWRLDNSPWVREIMEAFADDSINDISVMCASQSSKTQTIMNMLAWAVACAPGPAMWVAAAQDEAKTFARTRLMPTLERCEPVAQRFPSDRHAKTTLEINFASMPLIINGANSQSKLQSKPIRYLFLDEVRNYPPGALEMVLKRTRAFWNAKRIIISTPDKRDDAVHRAFLSGDQRRFHFPCTHCGLEQALAWSQVRWDTNDEIHPDEGKWAFDKVSASIRYECIGCKEKMHDVDSDRKHICRNGKWIKTNTKAPSNRVSFTWSALLPPWIRWAELVREFIEANEATKVGAIEPLKTFVNETLGEPWEELLPDEIEPISKGNYGKGETWTQESQRFLTVDVQQHCFWAVCRAWAKSGASRLIWEGRLSTFDDVKAKQDEFRVTQRRVLIDSGFNTAEVYEQCVKYGWIALKGEAKEYYLHEVQNTKPVRRIYSQVQRGDPGIGGFSQGRRFAPLILFASNSAKDVLSRLKRGQGPSWELPQDISSEYLYQIEGETKRLRHNRITGQEVWEWVRVGKRPNHLFDCECMQICAAVMARLLATPAGN